MPGRALSILRRQYRSVALGAMGRGERAHGASEGALEWAGQDHALLALPVDASALSRLQDHATAAMAFMMDYSPWDGPDGWA